MRQEKLAVAAAQIHSLSMKEQGYSTIAQYASQKRSIRPNDNLKDYGGGNGRTQNDNIRNFMEDKLLKK